MKTRTTLVCLLIALLCSVSAAAQSKPDFSGEWVLNEAASDWGPLPAPANFLRKIEHQEPNIKIVTTQSGRQGEVTTELKYTTDGKESINTLRGAEMKGTAKWDGNTLLIEYGREAQGMKISFKEAWNLVEEGKSITIATHIDSPQGQADLKIVLQRK